MFLSLILQNLRINEMIVEKIRDALEQAESKKTKTATLHFLSLKYAEDLMDHDLKDMCRQLGLKESMAAEIRKMRAVHLLMKANSLSI